MCSTPFTYYEGKLGIKTKYLISDKNKHEQTLGLISYRSLKWRLDSKSRCEKLLRRGCFNTDSLIEYSTLEREWKDKLTIAFGNPPEGVKRSWFAEHYEADRAAFNYYLAHRYGDDNKKLEDHLIEQYTYNASVLNTVLKMKANRKAYAKALGIAKLDIWQSLSNDVNAFKEVAHNLPATKGGLRRKASQYTKDSYAALISGKLANSNSRKVSTKQQKALIDELIAKHTNLDNQLIADVFNTVAKALGTKTVTAATIGNRKKESNLITFAGRNGARSLSNKLLMQHKRKAPSKPMLFWTLDGWDAELLFQRSVTDANGYAKTTYHNRLTIVMILDPFNKYPVGYAIGSHETPQLIKEAMRNAIQHTQDLFGSFFRPYQIQSDRYAIKKLTPLFEACTPHFTPAQAKNAKSKVIEPYFNYINKKYCKLMDNWSGHNVDSGSKNQPNADILNKIRHRFPDEAGVVKQLIGIVEAERAKKVDEFVERFADVPEHHRSEMNFESFLQTLGENSGRTIRLTGEGVTPRINGVRRFYDCFDVDFRKNSHEDWAIQYNPNDLSKVLAVSSDGKKQFVLEEKHIQPMALADRAAGDSDQMNRVNHYNKQIIEHITEQRKENSEVVGELMQHEQLNDTLAKHLLVDSAGQHKNNRNESRKLAAKAKMIELKVIEKQTTENETSHATKQKAYYAQKVELNKYL